MHFKIGELFCGPGGFALGAKNLELKYKNQTYQLKHAWATDIDRDSCNTYCKNICLENPQLVIRSDVSNKDLFKQLNKISSIDILTFGFPCNDFSIIGKKNGINGKYGPLYSFGVKALNKFKPMFFVAENVGGLRSSNSGKSIQLIFKEFSESGYKIFPHYYKMEDYGIPQTRHRVIVVGIREDQNIVFKIPAPTHKMQNYITCKNAIENPPINGAPNNNYTKQSENVIKRLQHIGPGENAFTARDKIPEKYRLKEGTITISQIYKRLDPTKPSYTVTGSGGGGTHIYHWEEDRALTNRERARLQTFPDNFVFCGSKESVRRQIGMSVPPKFSRILFIHLLMTIAGKKYEFVEQNMDFGLQELLINNI